MSVLRTHAPSASADHNAGEHNILYQYYLVNAQNHYMGLIQTETVRPSEPSALPRTGDEHAHGASYPQPYFQPNPVPPAPFIPNSAYKDPSLGPGAAWALAVSNSQNILVFGTSL